MTTLIRQPANTPVCGACCFAMITGQTLYQVLNNHLWQEFTQYTAFNAALAPWGKMLGMIVGFSDMISSSDILIHDEIDVRTQLKDRPALLTVQSKSRINPTGLHFVYWDGKKILDPSGEQVNYDILEWCPITELGVYDSNENLEILISRGFITNQLDLVRLAHDCV